MTAEMQTVTNYMEATNFKKKKGRVKYINKYGTTVTENKL